MKRISRARVEKLEKLAAPLLAKDATEHVARELCEVGLKAGAFGPEGVLVFEKSKLKGRPSITFGLIKPHTENALVLVRLYPEDPPELEQRFREKLEELKAKGFGHVLVVLLWMFSRRAGGPEERGTIAELAKSPRGDDESSERPEFSRRPLPAARKVAANERTS